MKTQSTSLAFVKPTTRTTLEIDAHWFPARILTAEQAICAIMRERTEFTDQYERVKVCSFFALDDNLTPYDWDTWYARRAELIATGRYPILRSSKDAIPIPTTIRIKDYFKDPKLINVKRYVPTLKELLEAHNYTCAITGVRYDPAEFNPSDIFNIDHVVPRALGGPNDDTNMVLSTKKANSEKDCQWPYKTTKGTEIKVVAHTKSVFSHLNLRGVNIRPEWKGLLFK